MTDPASCGPVTLSFCQDVQAETSPKLFSNPIWRIRRPAPDRRDLEDVAVLIRKAKNPVIVAGGGAIYNDAEKELADFATRHAIPVIETQAGKSAPPQDHPMNLGAVGVDGSAAANALARKADLAASVCALRILRPAGADFGKVC